MLRTLAAFGRDALQRFFALREVGVGEGDHGLVQLGVVHDLADFHRERAAEVRVLSLRWGGRGRTRPGTVKGHRRHRRQRRQARDHLHRRRRGGRGQRDIGHGRRRGDAEVEVRAVAATVATVAGRRCRLGGRGRRAIVAGPAATAGGVEAGVADHLLLNLVDLGFDTVGPRLVVGQPGFGVVQPRRGAQGRQLLRRQTLAAHAAQHVELALAHKVVAPFALDHGPELGLLQLKFFGVFLARREVGPVGGRVRDEPHHFPEETLVLGHEGMVLRASGGVALRRAGRALCAGVP